jgi:hypothetical protein
VSQNDCNKCALNNHESQYWPCDSNPPLCDCGLELNQGGSTTTTAATTTTTTSTTATTTTTTTAPPSQSPTTANPTEAPTNQPTNPPTSPIPTKTPTQSPTSTPTTSPTEQPTSSPTTPIPTQPPTTASPTEAPTNQPTDAPTTASPTEPPTNQPTSSPSTSSPSPAPTTPPTKQPVTGSAGWYADGNKCAYGEPTTETLYPSASECCDAQLRWISNELCVSLSTGVSTNKFYADQSAGVCRQDCPVENGLPCGGSPQDTSLKLFNSLEFCCTAKISWDPSCIDKSNGNEPQGSGKYYVNWGIGKCALDCPAGSAGCGGVANVWDLTYDTADACCSAISWIDRSKCVYQ